MNKQKSHPLLYLSGRLEKPRQSAGSDIRGSFIDGQIAQYQQAHAAAEAEMNRRTASYWTQVSVLLDSEARILPGGDPRTAAAYKALHENNFRRLLELKSAIDSTLLLAEDEMRSVAADCHAKIASFSRGLGISGKLPDLPVTFDSYVDTHRTVSERMNKYLEGGI